MLALATCADAIIISHVLSPIRENLKPRVLITVRRAGIILTAILTAARMPRYVSVHAGIITATYEPVHVVCYAADVDFSFVADNITFREIFY